jgi:hypothetical protein
LAVYEKFRLELETAKMRTDVDLAQVSIFSERIKAENMKISRFIAILDSIAKRGDLEKLKTEIYGEQVRAYVASLSRVQAETGVYTAAMRGDEYRMRGELAKVDVFAKETSAAVQQEQLKIERVKAITSTNAGKADQYRAEIARYQTDVQAESTRYSGDLAKHKAELDTEVAEITAKREVYLAEYQALVGKADIIKHQAQADIERVRVLADLFTTRTKLATEAGISVGGLYAKMAAATLSSQNTMVSKIVTE